MLTICSVVRLGIKKIPYCLAFCLVLWLSACSSGGSSDSGAEVSTPPDDSSVPGGEAAPPPDSETSPSEEPAAAGDSSGSDAEPPDTMKPALSFPPKQPKTRGYAGYVVSAVFSPHGRYILSAGRSGLSFYLYHNRFYAWTDVSMKLWDAQSGAVIRSYDTGTVDSVAFSPDGYYALSGGSGKIKKSIQLWEVETGTEVSPFSMSSRFSHVNAVAFSPDGQSVLAGGDDFMMLWEIASDTEIRRFAPSNTGNGGTVAFSPDGRYLLSAEKKRTKIMEFRER
ncbi:MAG: hypothetical protein GY862_23590 [Gammaproteobacteria bacterium]|nr:hypothetical protein [Gammaproteobacteria bacterium]